MNGVDELPVGSEAFQEAFLQAAMQKHAGPRLMFAGMHGAAVAKTPSAPLAPTSMLVQARTAPPASEVPLGDLQDLDEVVRPELSPNVPVPELPVPTHRVVLSHQSSANNLGGFDLELDVTDIFVDEESISMALNTGARFKPQAGTRFNLKFNGTDYPVAFIGGAFQFPRLNLNGLSFVRLEDV